MCAGHRTPQRLSGWKNGHRPIVFCILLLFLLSIIMVDYQRMGNGGTRIATITLNNHALVYFKEFLQSKELVFHADKRTTDLAIW